MFKMKVKKGDRVKVIAGKDRGVISEVLRVFPKDNKVIVKGVGLVKKYIKEKGESKQIQVERPIHASNVMLVDDKGNFGRVGYKILKNGKKIRILKKTGNEI